MDVDVMELLAHHVPITLLADLVDPAPVASRAIRRAEPADIGWVAPARSQQDAAGE